MSLAACAEKVRVGDPDRFLATMAAPPAARAVLFPIWAFNLEVARAPWVSAEPAIGAMRLQWWRDALAEIAEGHPVRRHEVATPLAEVLDAEGARLLDDLVAARWADLERAPFADAAALTAYLRATGGRLMQAAGRALGAGAEVEALGHVGTASAMANWFLAVPELAARGRAALPPGGEAELAGLAGTGLDWLASAQSLSRAARPATLTAWRARGLLRRARRDPAAVAAGRLAGSEFRRRATLILASLRGI